MAAAISSEKIDLLVYGPHKPIVDNGFSDQFVLHKFETRGDQGRERRKRDAGQTQHHQRPFTGVSGTGVSGGLPANQALRLSTTS